MKNKTYSNVSSSIAIIALGFLKYAIFIPIKIRIKKHNFSCFFSYPFMQRKWVINDHIKKVCSFKRMTREHSFLFTFSTNNWIKTKKWIKKTLTQKPSVHPSKSWKYAENFKNVSQEFPKWIAYVMLCTPKKLKKKSKLEPESINSGVTMKKVELRCSWLLHWLVCWTLWLTW